MPAPLTSSAPIELPASEPWIFQVIGMDIRMRIYDYCFEIEYDSNPSPLVMQYIRCLDPPYHFFFDWHIWNDTMEFRPWSHRPRGLQLFLVCRTFYIEAAYRFYWFHFPNFVIRPSSPKDMRAQLEKMPEPHKLSVNAVLKYSTDAHPLDQTVLRVTPMQLRRILTLANLEDKAPWVEHINIWDRREKIIVMSNYQITQSFGPDGNPATLWFAGKLGAINWRRARGLGGQDRENSATTNATTTTSVNMMPSSGSNGPTWEDDQISGQVGNSEADGRYDTSNGDSVSGAGKPSLCRSEPSTMRGSRTASSIADLISIFQDNEALNSKSQEATVKLERSRRTMSCRIAWVESIVRGSSPRIARTRSLNLKTRLSQWMNNEGPSRIVNVNSQDTAPLTSEHDGGPSMDGLSWPNKADTSEVASGNRMVSSSYHTCRSWSREPSSNFSSATVFSGAPSRSSSKEPSNENRTPSNTEALLNPDLSSVSSGANPPPPIPPADRTNARSISTITHSLDKSNNTYGCNSSVSPLHAFSSTSLATPEAPLQIAANHVDEPLPLLGAQQFLTPKKEAKAWWETNEGQIQSTGRKRKSRYTEARGSTSSWVSLD